MRTLYSLLAAAALTAAALGIDAQETHSYDLDIVNPTDAAVVFSDDGDVWVRASVVPDLAPGDQVELLVDGLPAAAPGAALEFPLSGIAHGPHHLQVRVIDSTGNVGSISPPTTLYVLRAALRKEI